VLPAPARLTKEKMMSDRIEEVHLEAAVRRINSDLGRPQEAYSRDGKLQEGNFHLEEGPEGQFGLYQVRNGGEVNVFGTFMSKAALYGRMHAFLEGTRVMRDQIAEKVLIPALQSEGRSLKSRPDDAPEWVEAARAIFSECGSRVGQIVYQAEQETLREDFMHEVKNLLSIATTAPARDGVKHINVSYTKPAYEVWCKLKGSGWEEDLGLTDLANQLDVVLKEHRHSGVSGVSTKNIEALNEAFDAVETQQEDEQQHGVTR
jgi:hypothetical protein